MWNYGKFPFFTMSSVEKSQPKWPFFLGRVSLWTTADLVFSNPYAFTLLLFPWSELVAGDLFAALVHTTTNAGAHTNAHLSSLSCCLQERPACSSRRKNTLFVPLSYVRWHHFSPLLMPILYSRTSEEVTQRPIVGRGFISGFSFPPVSHGETEPLCHSVGEMAPHYSPKRVPQQQQVFESFPSFCAQFMGGFFYPGFSSRRRAGPGVAPGTFGLEIRCSTNEPFQPPQTKNDILWNFCPWKIMWNVIF